MRCCRTAPTLVSRSTWACCQTPCPTVCACEGSTELTLWSKATPYSSWLPAHGPPEVSHVRGAMSLTSPPYRQKNTSAATSVLLAAADLSNACCVCNRELLYCVGWGCGLKCSCCCSWRMLHLLPCRGQGSCWQSPGFKPTAGWLQSQTSRFVRCN